MRWPRHAERHHRNEAQHGQVIGHEKRVEFGALQRWHWRTGVGRWRRIIATLRRWQIIAIRRSLELRAFRAADGVDFTSEILTFPTFRLPK